MMIVGLTGGIGSGKSTVANFFKTLGVPVYNSDIEAKKLMQSSEVLRQNISLLFGAASYKQERLNTKHIAKQVFADKSLLEKLNALVHPAVRAHFISWAAQQHYSYVIQESAIVFENKAQGFYDKTILVTTPKEIRIARVTQRDHSTAAQVVARMNNQMSDTQKIPLADYIIENIALENTEKDVLKIHKNILAAVGSSKF